MRMNLPGGSDIDSPASSRALAEDAPPTIADSFHALVNSTRKWLDGLLHLVALETRKAAFGLALMIAFAVGAVVLLVTGWLALVACVVAVLVENQILGWGWSLLIAAMLSFAGSGGLILITIRRSTDLLFHATRRQLGLTSAPSTHA